ncbi:transcriptional repressor [Hallella multisaccharivorax DSM 17128]|uniref:Ferric uptake regulator, Fur family n=1 Tax=Hallella multisaccharivorax DSM 17128 TaxID=688246 RepID=F8NCQ7_9BACT|nr:transcriptional repressor [Hallella multisaccharivorax]EGN58092.1 ferric uptake regulator, Fur family [Hallella multisaccharivorax DSM 17128]GJG31813.1 transcriptional repressor [Hallella multisaccharivorax DSM 17128]
MDITAYRRLVDSNLRPSTQRLAIMTYLLSHRTHPTVEDVYQGVVKDVPTLSRTTVYNTLRLFSERRAAQMITIDDHHVCYDGDIHPHVHFLCRECGRVLDLMDEKAPKLKKRSITRDGNLIDEAQLYYKGVCRECLEKEKSNNKIA